ncbi:MAG: hypothetical protein ACR2HJ_05095 [Fimbriimonadales bacterium]
MVSGAHNSRVSDAGINWASDADISWALDADNSRVSGAVNSTLHDGEGVVESAASKLEAALKPRADLQEIRAGEEGGAGGGDEEDELAGLVLLDAVRWDLGCAARAGGHEEDALVGCGGVVLQPAAVDRADVAARDGGVCGARAEVDVLQMRTGWLLSLSTAQEESRTRRESGAGYLSARTGCHASEQ